MSVFIIPQNQIIYNDPYSQRLFEYQQSGALCEYVLARTVNDLLKLYGDKVFKGLKVTSASVDGDNNLIVNVEKGVAVADSTLIFINEDVTLTFPNIDSLNVESGNFAVFLNYQYIFTPQSNPAKLVVYFVDSETTNADSSFDSNRDRVLLSYISVDSLTSAVTIHNDINEYLIVNNNKYYIGSGKGEDLTPFDAYLGRSLTSNRILGLLYDSILQTVAEYIQNNILEIMKQLDGSDSGLDADLLDGHDSEYFADKELSNVDDNVILNKLKNVDTDDSGLNATTLQGRSPSDFAKSNLENVNDNVILSKLKNVDGPGSGLDADTLDGKEASEFADNQLTSVNDNVILTKLKNVDGPGSGLDADLLDGHDSEYFADRKLFNVDDDVILTKLKNVDGPGSGLNADKLGGYKPSNTPKPFVIPVTNADGKIPREFLDLDDGGGGGGGGGGSGHEPIIDSVQWSDDPLHAEQSSTVTINAHDPDGDTLQYKVVVDGLVNTPIGPLPGVTIEPSGWSNNNTFTVTPGGYGNDYGITFKYFVSDGTNETTQTEVKDVVV